jgi:acetyltransferase-like isoleucine patch superfamily enzyme
MSLTTKIRRGEGPFWGALKKAARAALRFHIPVVSPTRPLYRLLYNLHVVLRESFIWALRFFWYEPLFRSQCVSVGQGFQMEKLPYLTGKGRIMIGERVRFSGKPSIGFSSRVSDAPELIVGDGTFIGHNCTFHVARSVTIGKNCLLAGGVKVHDFDGHPVDAARRRANEPFPPENSKAVNIGDDVWVGTGALILKGVTVGSRSIVGAGAVVTKDVPADVIVAGNPARVVKHLSGPMPEL